MEEDTSGVSQAFSFPNGGGSEGDGEGLIARTWRRAKATLTEGRSARDLTQAATSQKKRGLRSGSVRKAAAKVESISAGRRGGGPPNSRSFRPTRSLATSSLSLASFLPLFHLVSPKPEPSRSFRPTRFLAASCLVLPLALPPLSPFSYFFSTARTQWVFPAHGLLQLPLSSLLPPSSLFYLSLNPVGHSGTLGSWLPPTLCPLQLSRDSLLS